MDGDVRGREVAKEIGKKGPYLAFNLRGYQLKRTMNLGCRNLGNGVVQTHSVLFFFFFRKFGRFSFGLLSVSAWGIVGIFVFGGMDEGAIW